MLLLITIGLALLQGATSVLVVVFAAELTFRQCTFLVVRVCSHFLAL